jgi:hypothetical protein
MNQKNNGAMHQIMGKNYNLAQGHMKVNLARPKLSRNYKLFSFLDDNRELNKKHIGQLVASFVQYGQIQPIVCNKKLQVIDGQHRFRACVELDLPVFYIINQKATTKIISVINNTQKGWVHDDYIRHFSHANHPNHLEYRKVASFKKEHNLPFAVIFLLCRPEVSRLREDLATTASFKDGTFKAEDWALAKQRAEELTKIKTFSTRLATTLAFVFAFLKCKELEGFDINLAYKQIKKNESFFNHCNNQLEWVEAFVKVYNHRLITKQGRFKKVKKISIRKEGF